MRLALIPVLMTLALPLAAAGQDMPPPEPWAGSFRPMPFHRLADRVTDRYQGRVVAAAVRPPAPRERALGAELVYEFRLLTPTRNMLNIRLDARDGRFLEVAGRGQLQARRRP